MSKLRGYLGPRDSRIRQNIESIVVAIVIALAVRSSVVQAFWVPSGSMLPTIQIGDHLFVNKLAYAVRLPFIGTPLLRTGRLERGEVVVFVSPDDHRTDLIKRVVAVAGDEVQIRGRKLLINGAPVEDPHAHFTDQNVQNSGPRDNFGPVMVPEGKFFFLGDNRDFSRDSRFLGFADVDDIKGKATFIYWSREPPSNLWAFLSTPPRLNRFGHFIR